MNHLAHLYLSPRAPGMLAGALLADRVRRAQLALLPRDRRLGVELHWSIDRFTDSHPLVLEARSLFSRQHRRPAPVLLDIWFDHLLARDWSRWSDEPLRGYETGLAELLEGEVATAPGLARMAQAMAKADWLSRYAERAGVEAALARAEARMRRPLPLQQSAPELQRLEEPLYLCFTRFFPQLRLHAAQRILELQELHPRECAA